MPDDPDLNDEELAILKETTAERAKKLAAERRKKSKKADPAKSDNEKDKAVPTHKPKPE